MREPVDTIEFIWLEVSNIALDSGGGVPSVALQLKGDADTERSFQFRESVDALKVLIEAMKEKRPIYAKLGPKEGKDPKKLFGVTEIRVAFSAGLIRN